MPVQLVFRAAVFYVRGRKQEQSQRPKRCRAAALQSPIAAVQPSACQLGVIQELFVHLKEAREATGPIPSQARRRATP